MDIERREKIRSLRSGDIIYYITKTRCINFGVVVDVYPETVIFNKYQIKKNWTVNGVVCDDKPFPTKWCKLPKGWSWDYELAKIDHVMIDVSDLKVDNPDDIRVGIDSGRLVLPSQNKITNIESEIDRKYGWRLIAKSDQVPDTYSLPYSHIYLSYEEARNEIEKENAELIRQSNLSDYDWSVEQIDHELGRLQTYTGRSDDLIKQYREHILSLENVEDVEVRVFGSDLQWKYCKNKKWITVEI